MKKLLLGICAVALFLNVNAQTVTEVYVPQFMGSKTAASVNNARVYFPVCIRIDGLQPNVTYTIRLSLGLTTDANTSFGAGNIWSGSAMGSTNPTFTTNGAGSTGNIWFYFQPTGNSTRFGGGAVHNIRVGWAIPPASVSSAPTYIGTKTITALDIANTALTPATTDDGAFLIGQADTFASGSIVLLYNNVAGTGDPISISRIRRNVVNQISNSELPGAVDSILRHDTLSIKGQYAAVIPIGANNANGIRRIETRDTLGNLIDVVTDADGIWPSGGNTTTVLRRGIVRITNTDAPLPVRYKFFTASATAYGASLKWSTASEKNNRGFEVQRSVNGSRYVNIGFVTGAGNSNRVSTYSFNDFESVSGNVCYRLKQVDFDGKTELSKVICVAHATEPTQQVITSPNPFNENLNITYYSNKEADVTVQVFDMLGKVHVNELRNANKGNNQYHINTEALPNGIYFVRITNGTEITTQRIIKK
ncbi:MAG: T9SS type A sorting domain-containing protein [Bacteroidia bacterium]|jgi:hypothetical protein|nr:T9SS type A sorting domain-containing protein [Bacteroidia bacterium]